ncbi:uncharacterized protein FOMMEDRAFT_101459 [Fomitiporia mediterranea MF3/22]|uniref:uncharacterized protein n=1 Tax=Fomitiporia mediterranea (strain MF3/22) TaxID=694068 RepID=UPI0004408BA0|nr:uncharacterized protein FOMMEDRAFT_101459 [Fomitiporia mediterranea MF3/22]EJD08038.1 hypothetical protein FOMMEDRAFT_101459 [Fomitiporia mediterranea MF3/22]
MSKAPLTSVAKPAGPLSKNNAWAKGPPPPSSTSTSSAPSPRPQSPAVNPSQATSQTHSRRSSQHASFKDAVGVGIAGGSRGNVPTRTTTNPINFGTVNGSASDKTNTTSSPATSPAPAPPSSKTESRQPVQSFGSIEATQSSMPTTAKPSVSSASSVSSATASSSAASASSATSISTATSATTPHNKPKVDVSALFRGTNNGGDAKTSSPVTSSFPESVASPPMRSNTLSPAVPPTHTQNPPGPPPHGPHPHAQPHQQHPQGYPQPFIPANMRNQGAGGGPRSPSFQRGMPNGAGGRPPVTNPPPGANNSNVPSPRLAPPQPHMPHQQHQHQHQQAAPVQGMPPHAQMQAVPGWPGYYYPYMPGMPMQAMPGVEHYMQYQQPGWPMHPPQHPHQPPSGASGPPQTPLSHSHGLPVASPRVPPPPLQAPGTPPAGVPAPLPSAGPRLNSNASAFVPSGAQMQSQRPNRVVIKDASGHEVDLNGLRKQGATPSTTPSTPASDKNGRRTTAIRLESEEMRLKRIADEEREKKAKEEGERKKREAKEAEERKRQEEEARAKAAEEERIRAEEDRKRKVEEERLRKEEEEKERLRLEEEERKRKEEEEERQRLRKEEEEKERLRKEEEERVRKEEEECARKEAEERERQEQEERQRREEEERQQKAEEEERQRKEEEDAKAKAEAEAKADVERPKPAALEIKSKKEGDAAAPASDVPLSTSPETSKRRPIPGPLDLSTTTHKSIPQPLPSALATARHIQDVYQVPYPEGIKSPKPELNTNAKDGKFRYDRDFLLQFMSVCKEKPDNLPPLEAIGLEPSDQSHSMGRGGSGRRGVSGGMGPPSSTASRQASIGLGIGALNGFGGKPGSGFAMGNFSTAPNKLSSEERFIRSTSMSGGPGGLPFPGGRPSPMQRSSSQGGPGAMGNKRTRSKRGDATRNETNRINASASQYNQSATMSFEPVAPLEQSANRWVAASTTGKRGAPVDQDSPEVVDKKVRALLNKLTMEKFESISNQIITWANKSESEKDGRTLIQVIRLVFEKATDEAAWSEMYARLCRKMMEQISPHVQDDGIRNNEGKPITGGLLFRKYLLNRCQEDFERGWSQKESTAAAALVKATEDAAIKNANDKNKEAGEESALYSEEYYAAQKAKRQGLGLIKFIGELFKLQMLTERIMHECIKKLLSNVDNPEEEEIESLCKLLTTVGQALDTSKARGHMDVYFSRMKELSKSSNVSSRMQFMLQDVIELRERKWIPRSLTNAPTTLAQVHETAAKEKAQQEQHNLARSAMSRGGSRRGQDRDGNAQVGADGWAVASGPSRPPNKAGDLTNFGKIQKGSTMTFGPSSVFTKKGDTKRDSASLSRASSNTNMFQMLQAAEAAGETPVAVASTSSRASRPSSRTASVDLTHGGAPAESAAPTQRPKLNLLPRSKPLLERSEPSPAKSHEDEEGEEGEILEDTGKASMSKEDAEKKVEQDKKEFFAIRDLAEGEEYFSVLPSEHRHILVEKLILYALEAKEADAKLVADLFERAVSRNLCSPASFEEGFGVAAEVLDDIAIDAPKAFSLMAIMMKGAKLDVDEERRTRIASKSMDSEKLLGLLA